jgi:hypothetical protein
MTSASTDSSSSVLEIGVRRGKSVDTSGHASGRRTTEDENVGRDASAGVPTRPARVSAPPGKSRGFRESVDAAGRSACARSSGRRFRLRLALLALWAWCAAAQTAASLEVVLERRDGEQWIALDPRTVLRSGDPIRFRFQTTFAGFLSVYYRGSDGETDWLFPTAEAGTDNRVEAGRAYLIPPGPGFFEISGPPGFDSVYWLLSPKPLGERPALPQAADTPRTMIPHCRDALQPKPAAPGDQRACLDDRAGARAGETLRPREIRLSGSGATKITPAQQGTVPVLYEFRLAHQ